MPDYLRTARLLRVKAADPVVPDTERRALLERAADLEAKYGNSSSTSTNDTTVTGRDGRFSYGVPTPPGYWEAVAEELLKNQWRWNRPPEADIVEEDYQTQSEDEDYGYDIYEGTEWK